MVKVLIALGLGSLLLGLVSGVLATAALLAWQLSMIGVILLVAALFIEKTK